MPAIAPTDKKTPFLSIIWGYSTHMYGFAPEENYHIHMLIQAKQAGFQPYALVRNSKSNMEHDPHFDPAITVLDYKNIFHFIFQVLKFSLKNSVFYVNSYEWQSFLVPFLARRTIFMAHTQPKRASVKKQKIQNFVYRFFTKIRLITETEKEFLRDQGIAENKLAVVPLVVSDSIFRVLPDTPARTNLISFGNVTEKKNLGTILKAFELVRKQLPNMHWHIIGALWDTKFEQAVAHSPIKDAITLHGFLPSELSVPYLNTGLVYANASTDEGQCIAVYDAALCGCALALPKIMSFEGIFKDSALFHEVYDADQLAKNIMTYATDSELRKEHSSRAITLIKKNCSQAVVESKIMHLLKTI